MNTVGLGDILLHYDGHSQCLFISFWLTAVSFPQSGSALCLNHIRPVLQHIQSQHLTKPLYISHLLLNPHWPTTGVKQCVTAQRWCSCRAAKQPTEFYLEYFNLMESCKKENGVCDDNFTLCKHHMASSKCWNKLIQNIYDTVGQVE